MQRGYRRIARTPERLDRIRNRLISGSVLQNDEAIIRRLAYTPSPKRLTAIENQVFSEFGVVEQRNFEGTGTLLTQAYSISLDLTDAIRRFPRRKE
ncbi:MAG: hypothetical protein AABX02_03565, partial [archaeon]